MNLNPEQHRLAVQLIMRGACRTDKLAESIGQSNSHTAKQLLPMRANGLVTSLNDGGDFVVWQTTPALSRYYTAWNAEQKLKEEEARHKCDKVDDVKHFILWCPTSNHPAKVTYPSYEKAQEVQAIMANRNPGQVFHICAVLGGLKAEQVTHLIEV